MVPGTDRAYPLSSMSTRVLAAALLLTAGLFLAGPAAAQAERPEPKLDHTSKDPMKCEVCRPACDKAMERVRKQLRRSTFPVKMICGFALLADGRYRDELEHVVDCAVGWRKQPGYRERSHPGNWYPALAAAFLCEVQKHRPEKRVLDAMKGIVLHFTTVQEVTGGWWKWHEGAYKERLDYGVVDHGFITALVMGFFHTARRQGVEIPETVFEQGEASIERITNDRGVGYGSPRAGGRSGGDKTGGRGALLFAGLAYAGTLDHHVVKRYRKVLPAQLPNLDQGHHVGALHGLAVTMGCHVLGPKAYDRLIELWLDRLIRKQEEDGGLYIGDDGDAGGEPGLLRSNVGSTSVLALMILLQDHDRLVPPDRGRDPRDGSLTVDTSKDLAKRRDREKATAEADQRRRAAGEAREKEKEARKAREKAIAGAAGPWNAKLLLRVRRAIDAGTNVRFRLLSLKKGATVTGVDESGLLRISAGALSLSLPLPRLAAAEKSEIALAVLRENHPRDHATAAFFALAAGEIARGRTLLAKGDEEAVEVEEFFRELGIL